ncbi:VOC family protein [Nonomuraea pusilla]|uniref:Glyoxalase-like domain-containing protein n=1 Tax=Nonomuraea pusilla TaxID=46177 RepID=A0A1H7WUZ8_9ACTN|nr:VOC family protein [Nonomuraea pusilla]SEM25362.1 Glyoxalase-like domain-containing protein [Nonomuraea pusilla]
MTAKSPITGVRTVAVPVTDQDRALAFYVGALGMEKRLDAPLGQVGGRWIEVAPPGADTTIALVATPPRPSARDTPAQTPAPGTASAGAAGQARELGAASGVDAGQAQGPGAASGRVDTGIRLTTADAELLHADLLARGVEVGELLRWPGVPPMFTFQDQDGNTLVAIGTTATP